MFYFQLSKDPREELSVFGLLWVRSANPFEAVGKPDPSGPSPVEGDFKGCCGIDRDKDDADGEFAVRLDGECGCSWRRSRSMSPWVCLSAGLSVRVRGSLLLVTTTDS